MTKRAETLRLSIKNQSGDLSDMMPLMKSKERFLLDMLLLEMKTNYL